MIFIQDQDAEKDDAMPVGGEDCGYRGTEVDAEQLDGAWGGSSEDAGEKGDIGFLTELGVKDHIHPILRESEENVAPLTAYVAKLEAVWPWERIGQSEDDGKDFWRKR